MTTKMMTKITKKMMKTMKIKKIMTKDVRRTLNQYFPNKRYCDTM